jgi:ATP-dependent DNA helicase RecQ
VAAFTATATPELRDELGGALGLKAPDVFVRGFLRDNITIETRKMPTEDRRRFEAIELVRNRGGKAPALIYAGTRRACEELTEQLSHAGFRAAFYHGGCDGESRRIVQDMFLNNEVDALIATNAFGMGIDKPDIRMLIHLHMPRSFEDYYQEFGRAGRDGEPSRAVMLWRGKDYRTHDFLIKQPREDGTAADPRFVDASMQRLSRMFQWAQSGTCSWRSILEYFGDPAAADLADGCDQCCRCAAQAKNPPVALTGLHEKAARIMLDCVHRWGVKYGRKKTVGILAGSRAVGIPTGPAGYGALDGWRMTELEAFVQALLDGGYLATVGAEYPVLDTTPKATPVLNEGADVFLSAFAFSPSHGERPSALCSDATQSEAEVVADEAIIETLKRWRKSKATELGVPPYRVFSNKVLAQLASRAPETEVDLLRVPGIGPGKVEAFGFELLGVIQEMVG